MTTPTDDERELLARCVDPVQADAFEAFVRADMALDEAMFAALAAFGEVARAVGMSLDEMQHRIAHRRSIPASRDGDTVGE